MLFKDLNIEEYTSKVCSGEIDLLNQYNDFILQHNNNKDLNAVIEVFEQSAKNQVDALSKKIKNKQKLGKLAGLFFYIKDNILVKGQKSQAASKILNNHTAVYTATVVERLLEEDAILLGRTNCDEFAMGSSNENSVYGICKNPLDKTKVPGGSSGGSAVVVASDMCHFSLGSDTGGSVRQPASFCDIVGYKPSYGLHSRYGIVAFASSLDQVGIFSQNVDLAKRVNLVIRGSDANDMTSHSIEEVKKPKPLKKVGVLKAFVSDGFQKEIKDSFNNTLELLKKQNVEIVELDFPYAEYLVSTYYILSNAEASSNLSRYAGMLYGYQSKDTTGVEQTIMQSRSEGFGEEVKRRILMGTFVLSSGYIDAFFLKAQKMRRLLYDKATEYFNEIDLILLPTTPNEAFSIGEKSSDPLQMYLEDICTVFASIVGFPAISVPMKKIHPQQAMGLQCIANFKDDDLLFDWSKQISEYIQKH